MLALRTHRENTAILMFFLAFAAVAIAAQETSIGRDPFPPDWNAQHHAIVAAIAVIGTLHILGGATGSGRVAFLAGQTILSALVVLGNAAEPIRTFPVMLMVAVQFATGASSMAGLVGFAPILGLYVVSNTISLNVWHRMTQPMSPHTQVGFVAAIVVTWFLTRSVAEMATRNASLRDECERLDAAVRTISQAQLDMQMHAVTISERSVEEERKHLTRELHDTVCNMLVNISMMMELALDHAHGGSQKLLEILGTARTHAQQGLLETRRTLREYRAVSTPEVIGRERLIRLAAIFETATKTRVRFVIRASIDRVDRTIDDAMYRIVQESLTNSFRHGGATDVLCQLWLEDKDLNLVVSDNGKAPPAIEAGIGITGMRERLAHLGGSIDFRASASGFVLHARIPVVHRGNKLSANKVTTVLDGGGHQFPGHTSETVATHA